MANRGRLCSRLARLEGAARTVPTTPPGVTLVRQILSQPGGVDQLADLSEVLCLGQTMREFEERQSQEQAPTSLAAEARLTAAEV
jgi:hypothetical protein